MEEHGSKNGLLKSPNSAQQQTGTHRVLTLGHAPSNDAGVSPLNLIVRRHQPKALRVLRDRVGNDGGRMASEFVSMTMSRRSKR